jgi:hypothetical protein
MADLATIGRRALALAIDVAQALIQVFGGGNGDPDVLRTPVKEKGPEPRGK